VDKWVNRTPEQRYRTSTTRHVSGIPSRLQRLELFRACSPGEFESHRFHISAIMLSSSYSVCFQRDHLWTSALTPDRRS
ncbi:TPA: hypothetical protein N0F65_009488, partial [Lagenidium giganteum]